jgi:hypothetical protein
MIALDLRFDDCNMFMTGFPGFCFALQITPLILAPF